MPRSPQREEQPHIGVCHPHQDRGNLRPGNGRVGPEGPGVVVAGQDTCPVQLIDPGVRPIDVRDGPIRDQIDRRQRRVGEGVGQNGGKLLPGEGSVQILRQRGNDLLVDRIVRIGLVPGIRRGKGPVAGEIELPQPGCQRDGLDGGDRLGGLKFSGLGAVHETILIRGSDVVVVPGALGHILEVVLIGSGFFQALALGVPVGDQGLSIGTLEGRAVGDHLLALGSVPAQEGGVAAGGGGQVIGAVFGDQLGTGRHTAAVGVEGDGKVAGLDGEGLILRVGIGPVVPVGGLDLQPVGPRRQAVNGIGRGGIEIGSDVLLPAAVALLLVNVNVIVGGQIGGAPGNGGPVAVAIGGRELVYLGRAGVGQLRQNGVLARGIGLEIDQPADGAVIFRQQLL